ncbi:very-long-chain enoyl-CoA reductase-like [Sarcoramphus papa]
MAPGGSAPGAARLGAARLGGTEPGRELVPRPRGRLPARLPSAAQRAPSGAEERGRAVPAAPAPGRLHRPSASTVRSSLAWEMKNSRTEFSTVSSLCVQKAQSSVHLGSVKGKTTKLFTASCISTSVPNSCEIQMQEQVEILDWKTKKQLCFLDKVEPNATIREIRLMFHKLYPRWYPARQSIKLDPKGKSLRDEEILQHLPVGTTATLYFKDLGPQIGWTTVFLIEYTGPLFIYFLFYFRMPFVYGLDERFTSSPHPVVNLACICHSFHYIKRLIETVFVHRFCHGTMPLRNIVKNCLYYWGFAAWLAYYINHPLYTPPSYGKKQINFAVIMFLLCEAGNFSIHVALSDLRRNGSKTRKIPYPTKNPFTWLFFFVSCPNYTYEVGTWISFTVMTQCVPVGLFTLLCFIQMTIWAKDKHCTYLREFKDYPSLRMPIIPFLL